MKKIGFALCMLFIAIAVSAHLTRTVWKGAVKGDNPQSAILKFGKDTLVLYAADKTVIETMTYSVKANVLSITKVSGQSDCGTNSTGKYKLTVAAGTMGMATMLDACNDRSTALDATKWIKQ